MFANKILNTHSSGGQRVGLRWQNGGDMPRFRWKFNNELYRLTSDNRWEVSGFYCKKAEITENNITSVYNSNCTIYKKLITSSDQTDSSFIGKNGLVARLNSDPSKNVLLVPEFWGIGATRYFEYFPLQSLSDQDASLLEVVSGKIMNWYYTPQCFLIGRPYMKSLDPRMGIVQFIDFTINSSDREILHFNISGVRSLGQCLGGAYGAVDNFSMINIHVVTNSFTADFYDCIVPSDMIYLEQY